jgi:hypothetical protein
MRKFVKRTAANLTTQQQDVKARFDNGERIHIENAHRMSGGDFRFKDGSLCHYRTFFNLMDALHGFGNPYPKENFFETIN